MDMCRALATDQTPALPDDIVITILAKCGGEIGPSVRLVSKQLRRCKDKFLTLLTINGVKVSTVLGHRKAMVDHLTAHMRVLSRLHIIRLPSFGPLCSLSTNLHTRLKVLHLLDCETLLKEGSTFMELHMRGISSLVNLTELFLGAPRMAKGGCSLGTLAKVLRPCGQLSKLELEGGRWISTASGLDVLNPLTSLRSLTLSTCPLLCSLDKALPLLQRLTLLHLGSEEPLFGLRSVDDVSLLTACKNLRSLQLLEADWAVHHKSNLWAFQVTKLTRLKMVLGEHGLPDVIACKRLKTLELIDCCGESLQLDALRDLTHLTRLHLTGNASPSSLDPLSTLGALRTLFLDSARDVVDFEPLRRLTRLRACDIRNLYEVPQLSPLSGLTSLTRLCLHCEGSLGVDVDVAPLSRLKSLKHLAITCATPAEEEDLLGVSRLLPTRPRLPKLCHLEISLDGECTAALAPLTCLTSLDILNSSDVTGDILYEIKGLTQLQHLTLQYMDEVGEGCLLALSCLVSLRSLSLYACHLTEPEIKELQQASGQLTELTLTCCSGFDEYSTRETLKRDGLEVTVDSEEEEEEEDEEEEEEDEEWFFEDAEFIAEEVVLTAVEQEAADEEAAAAADEEVAQNLLLHSQSKCKRKWKQPCISDFFRPQGASIACSAADAAQGISGGQGSD